MATGTTILDQYATSIRNATGHLEPVGSGYLIDDTSESDELFLPDADLDRATNGQVPPEPIGGCLKRGGAVSPSILSVNCRESSKS
eukprot:CAMPEP_0196659122 /NCGR_PEP_ID=MMETSP1086-20130531/33216_1 /TAXON_ID=77921 /ORGANISM="Cyanoptyche  gloeocystis , Strain SAG4.97" /LENGTH=85 /DNA_ID=CAMNT_0041992977 /DNA_START=59 /DNA_END=316 /DNA_ORIENTATION=-